MAPSTKHLSLLTLFLLISSLQIHARESQFFSKAIHYNIAKEAQPFQKEASPTKQQEPTTNTPQNQNGYGLYGPGTYQTSPTTTNNVDVSTEFPEDEYTGERSYQNKEFTTSYPNDEYENKQYGISDTRFLDNGQYFYDVNGDNYRNGYQSKRGSNQRFGSYKDVNQMKKYNNGGYYGNNENAYEYNNSFGGNKDNSYEDDEYSNP